MSLFQTMIICMTVVILTILIGDFVYCYIEYFKNNNEELTSDFSIDDLD